MPFVYDTIFLNQKYIPKENAQISFLDRGFLFADGIYEVIAIKNGDLFLLDQHLERLKTNLNELKINLPASLQLKDVCSQLISKNNIKNDAILYLQITRGAGHSRSHVFDDSTPPTVIGFIQSAKLPTINDLKVGFHATLEADVRWGRCNIKSISLLPNILVKTTAHKSGAIECLLHRGKIITEGSASNVFIVKNNEVFTPPQSDFILPGITRDYLIKGLKREGIPIKETPITVDDLKSADEVWITSTTRDVTPITSINEHKIGFGTPGPLWERAIKLFIKN